jgi:hypothetical protein
MPQGLSWKVDRYSTNQEIPSFIVTKFSPYSKQAANGSYHPVQSNPKLHTPYVSKIHFDIFSHLCLGLHIVSSFDVFRTKCMIFSFTSYELYTTLKFILLDLTITRILMSSGFCSMTGFGIRGDEIVGSATTALVLVVVLV